MAPATNAGRAQGCGVSRDEGFAIADTSTALPADPKFNVLWRRLRDKPAMCEGRTIYEDVRLASWAAGKRVTVGEAASLWLDPDPAVLAAMVAVGLLDDDHRIPEHVWATWYGTAYARRDDARLRGQIGGLMASLGLTKDQAVAEVKRRRGKPLEPDSSPAQARPNPSVRPSGPTDRPSAARAREDEDGSKEPPPKEEERPRRRNGPDPAPTPLADVILGMGLPLPVDVREPPAEPTR
jgi:hypothetical protein